MLRSNHMHKSVAVFLVLMVFIAVANSLAVVRVGHAAMGPVIAETVCHSVPSASSIPAKDDFKPPKHSFVDYDIFFTCVEFKPMDRPIVSHTAPDVGSKALSGALSEILIPPKI